MQTKKYEAPTIQEALDTIKRELGPEAIILQTKQNRRGFGLLSRNSVEVTAAVSEKALEKKKVLEKRMPEYAKDTVPKLSASKQARVYDAYSDSLVQRAQAKTQDKVEISKRASRSESAASSGSSSKAITTVRYADIDRDEVEARTPKAPSSVPVYAPSSASQVSSDLNTEIARLKAMVQDLQQAKNIPTQVSSKIESEFSSDAQQRAFELLVIQGMDRYLAQSVIKDALQVLNPREREDSDRVLDEVALRIGQRTRVLPFLEEMSPGGKRSVVALVGPTGVGKTTTIAKLASHAILNRNLRVALVNLDQFKVGASEQLSHFAQILRVPFRSVATRSELDRVLEEFQSFDLVLVDTAGRSQRDELSLRETEDLLRDLPDLQVQLVLSMTTRELELLEMGRRFLRFHPQTLIASKLDEVSAHGVVFNMAEKLDLPLSYFTTGQRVPEDLESSSVERVISLAMDL